jgi:EAL domain-containing protein (putative c-di-GMP-specific phosphodiesterase class I)
VVERLRELGVDYAQGNWISPPRPLGEPGEKPSEALTPLAPLLQAEALRSPHSPDPSLPEGERGKESS